MDSELVLMSRKELDELKELRELKDSLPAILQKARDDAFHEYEMRKLKALHDREKATPERNRERARKSYFANKERKKAEREAARLAALENKDDK